LTVVSDISRGLVCAAPGHVLIGADFSAVESRVLAWLAGEEWRIANYRRFDATGDPQNERYCVMASKALRRAVTPDDEVGRGFGKPYDLALGFGGGGPAWRRFDPSDTYSDAEIERFKQTYRRDHPATVRLWYALQDAAVRAIRHQERVELPQGKGIAFEYADGTLYLTLPSGRRICYPSARLEPGKFQNLEVVYIDNEKGKWCENAAWFVVFVELLLWGTARDLLAAALLRLEAAGFSVVLHVHDEIVAEVPAAEANRAAEFLALMLELPPWAEGLPIAGKVWTNTRYLKPSTKAEAPIATDEDDDDIGDGRAIEAPLEETATIMPTVLPEPVQANLNVGPNPAIRAATIEREETSGGNGYDDEQARDGNGYASGEREWGHNTAEYIYGDLHGAP